MFNTLKNILGIGVSVNYTELLVQGAQIIDVRSTVEYKSGHIKGSTNIPLSILPQQLHQLQKNKPIITCCASGMRSASAKSILSNNGFAEVYNGGGWSSLANKLNN